MAFGFGFGYLLSLRVHRHFIRCLCSCFCFSCIFNALSFIDTKWVHVLFGNKYHTIIILFLLRTFSSFQKYKIYGLFQCQIDIILNLYLFWDYPTLFELHNICLILSFFTMKYLQFSYEFMKKKKKIRIGTLYIIRYFLNILIALLI